MRLSKSASRVLRFAFLAAMLSLAACSGGGDGPVRYNGTTLVVLGKEYERIKSKEYDSIWGRGSILVTAYEGREAELEAVLKQFSLDVIRRTPGSVEFAVAVPVGFEEQWAYALKAQPSVFITANEDPTVDRL
jgi:hypothetical protein